MDVSVILPVHNAEPWFDDCLRSILQQKHSLLVELSVFLDCCDDNTEYILQAWLPNLVKAGYKITVAREEGGIPKGVGYSKNRAVNQSSGQYLCFMDADDMMTPDRIQKQYDVAALNKNAIVGSRFTRIPEGSTVRFTKWANSLTEYQLHAQMYTSHGPTVIMPTWFFHRTVFEKVGGFEEGGRGVPEDLIFFFKHMRNEGQVRRCEEELLVYRYHPDATTFSVHEDTIWHIRINELQERVLAFWTKFTIWNAGKQGRKFYRSLSPENRKKVSSFCDVDVKKIGSVYTYEESRELPKPEVPIIHFKDAIPPFIICVKMDLTGGEFEKNLDSLHLQEGRDYHHFN